MTEHDRKMMSDAAITASKIADEAGTRGTHENAIYLHQEAASAWNDLLGDRGGTRAANHFLAIEDHKRKLAVIKGQGG